MSEKEEKNYEKNINFGGFRGEITKGNLKASGNVSSTTFCGWCLAELLVLMAEFLKRGFLLDDFYDIFYIFDGLVVLPVWFYDYSTIWLNIWQSQCQFLCVWAQKSMKYYKLVSTLRATDD